MLVIEHTKPFVTKLGPVRILPGTNVISPEHETLIRGSKPLMNLLDENIKCGLWIDCSVKEKLPPGGKAGAVVSSTDSEKPTINPIDQIKKMGVADATKIIQKMFDVVTLRMIIDQDKRKGIQDVAKKQLELIQTEEPTE